MTKFELRRLYLGKRVELSASELASLSSALADKSFDAVDITAVKTLHCYLPIERFNEPDTKLIFERIWTNYPSVKTVVPRIDFASGNLESVLYSSVCPVVTNKWGVSEPEGGIVVPADEIDMTIVPLLCFDKRGFRVGYGKGYYDRFLAKCRPDCLKAGLSFFPPVEKIEDVGEHDIALDICLTPERLYEFGK